MAQSAQQLDETEQADQHRAQERRAVHVRPERNKRECQQDEPARPPALAHEENQQQHEQQLGGHLGSNEARRQEQRRQRTDEDT